MDRCYEMLNIPSYIAFSERKERLFPPGSFARPRFEYLHALGCDEQMLLSLLTIAVFKSQQDTTMLETYGIEDSAAELPGELEGGGAEP